MNTKVVIVSAKRTAIGKFLGSLTNKSAHELGGAVISAVTEQIKKNEVSEVIMGQVLTAGCGQNPARQATLSAGLSNETSAYTVNKVCGSGLLSVVLGAQAIMTGTSSIIVAGGQENMSSSPHVTKLRAGTKMGNSILVDTMIKDGLEDAFNQYHMGITAENVADKYKITRDMQDNLALASQNKAEIAQKNNRFADEIIDISITVKKENHIFNVDEFPKHNTTIETLTKLRTAFKTDGTVTAGNSSGINDGAAAVLLMSEDEAKKRGFTILARIESFGSAGVNPEIMGVGPINAIKSALQKVSWSIDDLDLIEANEAFASQAVAVQNALKIKSEIMNVNGGAIALGHPIGASGTRCLVTLIHEMIKRDSKKGLVSLCIGGGMGIAMCLSR